MEKYQYFLNCISYFSRPKRYINAQWHFNHCSLIKPWKYVLIQQVQVNENLCINGVTDVLDNLYKINTGKIMIHNITKVMKNITYTTGDLASSIILIF